MPCLPPCLPKSCAPAYLGVSKAYGPVKVGYDGKGVSVGAGVHLSNIAGADIGVLASKDSAGGYIGAEALGGDAKVKAIVNMTNLEKNTNTFFDYRHHPKGAPEYWLTDFEWYMRRAAGGTWQSD